MRLHWPSHHSLFSTLKLLQYIGGILLTGWNFHSNLSSNESLIPIYIFGSYSELIQKDRIAWSVWYICRNCNQIKYSKVIKSIRNLCHIKNDRFNVKSARKRRKTFQRFTFPARIEFQSDNWMNTTANMGTTSKPNRSDWIDCMRMVFRSIIDSLVCIRMYLLFIKENDAIKQMEVCGRSI